VTPVFTQKTAVRDATGRELPPTVVVDGRL
jgi:hypothetical protein